MSGSFGGQLPMLVIIALVVLAAAGGAIYLVRRFGVGAKPEGVARGRQSRLAVVDSASIVDGRKLIIVRRDNVEHLLLIGGATDVLVEPNIHRSAAAHTATAPSREAPAREAAVRTSEPEPSPRLAAAADHPARPSTPPSREIPLADGASWPLQPEHAARTVTSEPSASEAAPSATRPAEPVRPVAHGSSTARAENEPAAAPTDHFAELAAALQRPGTAGSDAKPAAGHSTPPAAAAASEDANLTDMAHRLEAALRRPLSPSGPTLPQPKAEPRRAGPPPSPRVSPTVEVPRMPARLGPEPRLGAEPRPTSEPRLAPEPKVDAPSDDEKPPFESLEREMASLLGRPPR
jgi:flagellar biogenesis protein FliO